MIEVLQQPFVASVQDTGRVGQLARGIPPNGAMDRFALRAVNALLANAADGAVMELHFPAGRFRFHEAAVICLGGADFAARLDTEPVPLWKPVLARAGGELSFDGMRSGFRATLGVWGGWDVPLWLGSRSTNLMAKAGGFRGRVLAAGDRIGAARKLTCLPDRPARWALSGELVRRTYEARAVRLMPGPEWDWLEAQSQRELFEREFVVASDSNRTGYRLHGAKLVRARSGELVSGGVTFGTMQLPASGEPIVLMADHPATGGYPRVAQVAAVDLPYLAQSAPGQKVRFEMAELEEAERMLAEWEEDLRTLAGACRERMDTWLRPA